MKNIANTAILLFLFSAMLSCNSTQRITTNKTLEKDLRQTMLLSKKQYEYFATRIPDSLFPKTFENGKHVFCKSWDWVSGFYPGTLILLSDYFKDENLYNLAVPKLDLLKKEQFNKNTHDLGFMMYCSFGNAIKSHPGKNYDTILLNSAESLASRYNPKVQAIKSWDSRSKDDFLVIIDNMMNLELLFWASRFTGDPQYAEIAVNHANTTMKNHFRDDYSSYHVVNYNPLTGEVNKKHTHQGAYDESAWARGQAWALYGYTLMYRETKDRQYLDMADKIAVYIIKNLPGDYIPVWDFNAPELNKHYKDASAGAIIASALLELYKYSPQNARQYVTVAENILSSLRSENYFAGYTQNGGFLLKHSVGHLPRNSEVDVPLTYADYYFIEAMLRYSDLNRK